MTICSSMKKLPAHKKACQGESLARTLLHDMVPFYVQSLPSFLRTVADIDGESVCEGQLADVCLSTRPL